jgi:hypothetical protein
MSSLVTDLSLQQVVRVIMVWWLSIGARLIPDMEERLWGLLELVFMIACLKCRTTNLIHKLNHKKNSWANYIFLIELNWILLNSKDQLYPTSTLRLLYFILHRSDYVCARLLLFSGRMAAAHRTFHRSSIWPHKNSLCLEALHRSHALYVDDLKFFMLWQSV